MRIELTDFLNLKFSVPFIENCRLPDVPPFWVPRSLSIVWTPTDSASILSMISLDLVDLASFRSPRIVLGAKSPVNSDLLIASRGSAQSSFGLRELLGSWKPSRYLEAWSHS